MQRHLIPTLTGGINNKQRADLIKDQELTLSENMEEISGDGVLRRRKDPTEYSAGITTCLTAAFATVINISPPYYPSAKPDTMTNDFMLLVYGLDGADYKLKVIYETDATAETWTAYALTGLATAGIAYTSDTVLRFAAGPDKIVITDYEGDNVTHYFTVDAEGDIISGIMGIPAPLNRPGITQMTTFEEENFEENPTAASFSECGLVQICYTVATEEGEESNPSPISETLDMQFFKSATDTTSERKLEKIALSNLSIPPGLSSDVTKKLKHFKIYARVFRYAAGSASKAFEFCQQHRIIDKASTTGATGNNYIITVGPTAGLIATYENDIAPIAKYPVQMGAITLLGCCKTKVKFPYDFSYFTEIKLNNQDSKTYIDAIVRIRLYDKNSVAAAAIDNLDWADFDTNADDAIESLDNLRIYDNDLTTPLPVIYTLDTSEKYCDIYIKIPQLPASMVHSLYLCFGGTGVSDADQQTAATGEWISATAWTGQKVYIAGKKVENTDIALCVPFNYYKINKADANITKTESDISWKGSGIAEIPLLGQTAEPNAIKFDTVNGYIKFADWTTTPDKMALSGFIGYNGSNVDGSSANYYSIVNLEFSDGTIYGLIIGWSGTQLDFRLLKYEGTESMSTFIAVTAPGVTAATAYNYFIMLQIGSESIDLWVVNLDDNTISSSSLTDAFPDKTLSEIRLGKNSRYDTIDEMALSQWIVERNTPYTYADTDDDRRIKNLANSMPPFDTIPGYNHLTHNNNITFEDTISAQYKTYENMVKYTNINHLSFPDLFYRKVKEPIKGMIAAPSFLQMKYENTVLIFTRNTIDRFLITGSPADFHSSPDSIIEEKTQYGLLAERTLVKVGETLFWLSETGVIRWDRRGLVPLSEHTIDIPLPTSDNDKYFAFYCPQRNQYILHREYEVYELLLESGAPILLESGEAILLE